MLLKQEKMRKKDNKSEKFEEELIKQILINKKINRFDVRERTFILDEIGFLVVGNENIKSNHKPKGLYINAKDIPKFVAKNLAGHDKNKYGVVEEVKEEY